MYNIQVKKRPYVIIAIVLLVVGISGIVFSMFLFNPIVEQIIKWAMPFRSGGLSRKFFLNVPFPLEFHCHVFSIQNPEAVQNGAKPILKDIGPYVFHEYILKENTVDDEENDSLTYTLKKIWIFKPELSNGLTGEEQITILHPVLNSMALTVNVDRKGFLNTVSNAITAIFNPSTPFWTGRAMDLLFDGIEIGCTGTAFAVESVCEVLKSDDIPAIVQKPNKPGFLQFSLLGPYNDSFSGRFTVLRGQKNIHDLARIIEIDGKTKMKIWLTDEANQYRGTDGYFLPPLLNVNEPILGFERMLCISLGIEFERNQKVQGFSMKTFTKNLKGFALDKAYCRKNGSCPIEGSLDLFNCMGVPIVATLPHFFDSHPSLLENIESGLEPKKEDHELFASIDLQTGVPLIGAKRIQFTFEILPIKEVEVMKNLRSMLFPFAWIEERVKLAGIFGLGLRGLFLLRMGVSLLKYLCLPIVLLGIASATIYFLIENGQIQVIDSPTSSVKVIAQADEKVSRLKSA